ILGGYDRRHEVGHQDGATELSCRERHHRLEHGAIAYVQVPIVRLANGYSGGHFIRATTLGSSRFDQPIGAAAAALVSRGASSIIAPVRSATRAKPRLAHHSCSPSMIAMIPDGLRKIR